MLDTPAYFLKLFVFYLVVGNYPSVTPKKLLFLGGLHACIYLHFADAFSCRKINQSSEFCNDIAVAVCQMCAVALQFRLHSDNILITLINSYFGT